MITYEYICDKLGFDPIRRTGKVPKCGVDDDNIFKVLELDELLALIEYLEEYKKTGRIYAEHNS